MTREPPCSHPTIVEEVPALPFAAPPALVATLPDGHGGHARVAGHGAGGGAGSSDSGVGHALSTGAPCAFPTTSSGTQEFELAQWCRGHAQLGNNVFGVSLSDTGIRGSRMLRKTSRRAQLRDFERRQPIVPVSAAPRRPVPNKRLHHQRLRTHLNVSTRQPCERQRCVRHSADFFAAIPTRASNSWFRDLGGCSSHL